MQQNHPHSFSKKERLKSSKRISALFKSGKAVSAYPLRVLWHDTHQQLSQPVPIQVAFAVPKRLVPHAYMRNRIKRRLREAYRLQKSPLCQFLQTQNKHIALIFIFTGQPEKATYTLLKQKVYTLLQNIQLAYNEQHTAPKSPKKNSTMANKKL